MSEWKVIMRERGVDWVQLSEAKAKIMQERAQTTEYRADSEDLEDRLVKAEEKAKAAEGELDDCNDDWARQRSDRLRAIQRVAELEGALKDTMRAIKIVLNGKAPADERVDMALNQASKALQATSNSRSS